MENILKGKNVYLRPLRSEDIPKLKHWRSDFSLKRLTGMGPFLPSLLEDINIKSHSEFIQFGIAFIETDELIGVISLNQIMWSNRVANLSVFIGDEKYNGKGLGSEAITLFIDYSFRELNLYRLQLVVVDYNKRAIACYEKLGFQLEGRLRSYGERDYQRYDVLAYGLLKSEWIKNNKAIKTQESKQITLETKRLHIRPFKMTDLDAVYHILDIDLNNANVGDNGARSRQEREQWLRWTIMSYEQLANLHQPPYGERAVILKETNQLIGACGFVPCLDAFELLPSFSTTKPDATEQANVFNSTEFGLFYAFSPAYQGQGYATEAVKKMVNFAFTHLKLKRIVATTTHDNIPSIKVMERIGMKIEKNPYAEPPWFQVVGILENPKSQATSTSTLNTRKP